MATLEMVKTGKYQMPDQLRRLPPSAADLVKRSLVLNPDERIKLSDILNHPFMVSF